jgi:sugar lactone lactonase YvrE
MMGDRRATRDRSTPGGESNAMSRMLPTFLSLAALLPAIGCGSPAPQQIAEAPSPPAATRLELPPLVSFPEGVAYDPAAGALYTASAEDGTLIRVNASTGAADVVAPAGRLMPAGSTTFPGPLGMEVDGRSRLWIAGGFTGKVWVVNTADGTVVTDVTVPTAPKSLINDVAIVGSTGYFTDTFVPTLWRLSAEGGSFGNIEPWLDLSATPIEYGVEGPNLNGITVTPDGRTLIVVHMGKGLLFKIDVATKAVTAIDTAGADLTTADGLVLDGNTLYVIRQGAQEIVTLTLNAELTSGTVVSRFTQGLAWPATAVRVGDDLVVVNTQFNTRGSATTTRPFTLLRVPVAALR